MREHGHQVEVSAGLLRYFDDYCCADDVYYTRTLHHPTPVAAHIARNLYLSIRFIDRLLKPYYGAYLCSIYLYMQYVFLDIRVCCIKHSLIITVHAAVMMCYRHLRHIALFRGHAPFDKFRAKCTVNEIFNAAYEYYLKKYIYMYVVENLNLILKSLGL